jgi:hypothetical protein
MATVSRCRVTICNRFANTLSIRPGTIQRRFVSPLR